MICLWLLGFLASGKTYEECKNKVDKTIQNEGGKYENLIVSGECSKNIFNQNDFLRSLHIEVASECNERCVHCYIPHEDKLKMIKSSLFYSIIEEGRNMNIINVTLSGGEPLLHKDFVRFLSRCRELDLSVNVLTNLTLLTDEILEEMKKNPLLSVQTSIYSMNSEVHDTITKVKGSFEKTKNNLLRLKECGIPLQISCDFRNIPSIPPIQTIRHVLPGSHSGRRPGAQPGGLLHPPRSEAPYPPPEKYIPALFLLLRP